MSKTLNLIKPNASNPKVWIVAEITVAGIIVLAETGKRRRKAMIIKREDFGAFFFFGTLRVNSFPSTATFRCQTPLSGLTVAIKDVFDVKGYVTRFGNPDWRRTQVPADKTAVVVTALLKNGAKYVGKAVMDELGFGITGENNHYGTPTNANMPSNVPGGFSSGSAVTVAAELVDFAPGTDTIGCRRENSSLILWYSWVPSITWSCIVMWRSCSFTIGLLNSQNLDAISIGWFADDPIYSSSHWTSFTSTKSSGTRRVRCLVFADDLFQLSKVP